MLRFCNSHPVRIWTAISFNSPETCGGEGGDWQNIGWYLVNPGSCVVVYENDLDFNRYWYYYAEADDAATWSGDFPTYVQYPWTLQYLRRDRIHGLPARRIPRTRYRG